ncbi:MAG: tetratricopeptide repeat protein [Phycisphaerales bacterium]
MKHSSSTPISEQKRAGSVEPSTIGLVVGALVSVVLIFFAAKTLIGGDPQQDQLDQEAAEIKMRAGEDAPKNAPIGTIEQVLESVQVYVSAQEFGPAAAILREAIGRYPSDADLRFALGGLLMMTRDFEQAYEQYAAGLEHDEGVNPEMQFTAGTLANTIDQPEMALRHYQVAMEGDPKNADYPLYLANIQFKLNQLEKAKASLAIAARLSPDRAMVYATWAKIGLRQNKLSIAKNQVLKARELEPYAPEWMVLEANIQKRDGNPERAIELLSAMPQSAMEDPEAVRLLAESYGMIGQPGEAASRMVDFATANSDDAKAAFDAAVWLERAKLREDAVLWGRRARDLGHPSAQKWLDTLPKG